MTLDDEISQIKTRCQFVYFRNIKLLIQFAIDRAQIRKVWDA